MRQEQCVVHVGAMRGILVASWASVHPNFAALLPIEAIEHPVVQLDERVQESAGRIKLQGQASLGEIHLHAMSAGREALPDVTFPLGYEIIQKLLTWVGRQFVRRIKQAESGHGDNRLLQRPLGKATSRLQK